MSSFESQHPDDLMLEAARTGEAPDDVAEHVRDCATCGDRSDMLRLLADGLSSSDAPEIPQSRHDVILELAHERAQLARAAGKKPRIPRWLVPAAAAFIIVVALPDWRHADQVTAGAALTGDVNGDGSVDIIDALVLARRLASDGEAAAQWDLNGDRRVDRGDVEQIAMLAVSLRGSSQ